MKMRVLPTLLALVLCGSSLYPSAGALEQSFQNPQLSRDEGAVTLKVQAPALSGQKVWMALYQEGKMEALALATQALEHELTATAQFSGDFDQVKLFGLDADGSPLILPLEAEYRGADLVITQPGLYQLGSYNNVIIDPSVGDGSVSLVNMEIGGDLLVQGGGGNTVALSGGTAVLGKISVEKAADGGQAPRLLLQDAQVERISLVTPGAVVEAGQPVQVVQLTASAGAQLRGPLQIEQVKAGGDLTAGAQTALGELAVLAGGTFHLAGPVGQIQLEEESSGARLTLCSGSTLVSGPGEAEQVRVSGQADVWVNATVTQAAVAGDAVGAGLTLDGVADTVAVEAGGTARQITLYAPTSLTVAGQVEELNVITAEAVRAEGTGSVAAVNASEPSALQLEGGLVQSEPRAVRQELKGLTIYQPPRKTSYQLGEELDTTGLVVIGQYEVLSGDRVITTCSGQVFPEISGFDSQTAGSKTLNLTCGGRSISLPVYVLPQQAASRAEFALSLYQLLQSDPEYATHLPNLDTFPLRFDDCRELPALQRRAISYLHAYEIMDGSAYGQFTPQRAVTRAQGAQIFVALFTTLFGAESQVPVLGEERRFADVAEGAWYAQSVALATRAGVLAGEEGADGSWTFRPEAAMTLAELEEFQRRCAAVLDEMVCNQLPGPQVTPVDGLEKESYPGAWITLAVSAQPVSGGALSYQWCALDQSTPGAKAQAVAGATGESYRFAVQDHHVKTGYFVLVRETAPDGRYGLTQSGCFTFRLNSAVGLELAVKEGGSARAELPVEIYYPQTGASYWGETNTRGIWIQSNPALGGYVCRAYVPGSNVPYQLEQAAEGTLTVEQRGMVCHRLELAGYEEGLLPSYPVLEDASVQVAGTALFFQADAGTLGQGEELILTWGMSSDPEEYGDIEYRAGEGGALELGALTLSPGTYYFTPRATHWGAETNGLGQRCWSRNLGTAQKVQAVVDQLGSVSAELYDGVTYTVEKKEPYAAVEGGRLTMADRFRLGIEGADFDPNLTSEDILVEGLPQGLDWTASCVEGDLVIQLSGYTEEAGRERVGVNVLLTPEAILQYTKRTEIVEGLELRPVAEEDRVSQPVWIIRQRGLGYRVENLKNFRYRTNVLRTRDGLTTPLDLEATVSKGSDGTASRDLPQLIYRLLPGDILTSFAYTVSAPEYGSPLSQPLTVGTGAALAGPASQVVKENPVQGGYDVYLYGTFEPGYYAMSLGELECPQYEALSQSASYLHFGWVGIEKEQVEKLLLGQEATLYHMTVEADEQGRVSNVAVSRPEAFQMTEQLSPWA